MKVCSVCQRCYEDTVLSCSEENHDLLTGAREGSCEQIQNYRLELLQESDAAGETYRAAGIIPDKSYLVKIIPSETFDEAAKKRFLSEAQSLATIYHPNLVRVFESGTLADGSLYVVSENFEAQTLRECMANVGKPSEVTAITITRQAAEGLEALHAAGVLHRNLKPENIILTSDAENKFLVKLQNPDFGALRQRQILAKGDLFLADVRYFAPEQCGAKETDAQADVYALGVVLYEALAGRVPFDAPYADAIFAKHLKETPPEVKINSFDLRMLLTHTLSDALQKQTRTRLKSANALTRRLRHIEQLATHSSTPPPAVAYPATMNKAAVVFTPPVKQEKAAPVAAAPPVVTPPPVEKSSPVEEAIPLEITNPVEMPPAEALTFAAEVPPATPETIIEEPEPVEAPALFEAVAEDPPALETENKSLLAAENEAAEEASEEALFETAEPAFAEIPAVLEEDPSAEIISAAEARATEETPEFAEIAAPVVVPAVSEAEAAAVCENENAAPESAPEDLISVGKTTFVKDLPIFAEDKTADEALVFEALAADEKPDEFEDPTAAENVPVFIDYTTTKLPPLAAIAEKTAPAGEPEVEIFRNFRAKNLGIHQTSEPALVDWEQPDDVPTVTAALSVSRKERADVQFVPNADVFEPKDVAADADETEYVSGNRQARRDYAALGSVFSGAEAYDDPGEDAGKSWNLPGRRTVLTGAAIAGLLVAAVGGTYLNRQIQTARADNQTTAKTSQSEKSLTKPAEPARLADAEKPADVKPEAVPISNPARVTENSETSDLPAYEPRATTLEKPGERPAPASVKKRPPVKLAENPKTPPPVKTETIEVFDKKGNVKTVEKNSANTQTPAKTDVLTRPRVVKIPR